MITMKKIKYLMWVLGVVAWNFGVPGAKPIYDIIMALVLKHIFELDNLLTR